MYNTGSYVLGVLIARATGRPFETFLRERLFEPLGMRDTGFSVPETKRDRLPSCYVPNAQTGALALHDGGAGLVSTADDYLAFARMLLDNGAHGHGRILSRPSIELMTTDHLTPEQKAVSAMVPGEWDVRGWGFGVSMVTRRDQVWATPGRYGWDGGFGTSWANDPKEGLIAILMTQRLGFPLFSNPYLDFWTSTYQAIDD